jgi:hypothetical protein
MKSVHFPEEVIEDVYVPEKRIAIIKLDHIGKQYGKWNVLRRVKGSDFEVQCECGFKAIRRIQNLYNGQSRQCFECINKIKNIIRNRL